MKAAFPPNTRRLSALVSLGAMNKGTRDPWSRLGTGALPPKLPPGTGSPGVL